MRGIRTAAILAFVCCVMNTAEAQKADACKQCREQYQRCMKNYPGKTCKIESDICLKTCRKT
jgi:hypothetical protein